MGALFIAGIAEVAALYPQSRGPETAGQRLDRELRERDAKHDYDIRQLKDRIESTRRLALMGYYE